MRAGKDDTNAAEVAAAAAGAVKKGTTFEGTTTDTMLVSLLQQLLMPVAVARKHGENVISSLGRRFVRPDHLAPVRSETGIGGRRGEVARAQREGRLPGAGGGGAERAQRAQPPSSHPCQREVNQFF